LRAKRFSRVAELHKLARKAFGFAIGSWLLARKAKRLVRNALRLAAQGCCALRAMQKGLLANIKGLRLDTESLARKEISFARKAQEVADGNQRFASKPSRFAGRAKIPVFKLQRFAYSW